MTSVYHGMCYAMIWVLCLSFLGFAQTPSEREIQLGTPQERETPLSLLGLSRADFADLRFSAFFVGSFSYNSHIQMVPEFAGGAPALADPGSTNFRFDKFGLSVSRTFAPWLSASAAIEVENHRDRHSHGFDPDFGCPGAGACIEQFGAEEAEVDVNLDRFYLTAVAPIGNGLALSLGRFSVPFGFERHDEPLLLTATTSEVFRFGRPDRMTGFQISYPFTSWLDANVWIVNRWENEATGEGDFNDNNRDKSFGGRIGFTPLPLKGLLNIGIGGFYGPEQDDVNSNPRWVVDVDATWTPLPQLLVAAEFVYGQEENREMRERGGPIAAPEEVVDVSWWGLYALLHYDLYPWLGLSFRYGLFDDRDGGRTGVAQVLQSWTVAPILHLSQLIPQLGPTGASYGRTRHPINWVDLKIEYRVNHSDESVFSDAEPATDILEADQTSHQVQVQAIVNF
jgi:Putative beta-barrel porin-2, OmpL-like. bbp2